MMEVRTRKLVYEQRTDKFLVDDGEIDSDTDAESDMSL